MCTKRFVKRDKTENVFVWFVFQWVSAANLTFDVTLVLLSFILAWGELWFLDFRVLPLESKAKEVSAKNLTLLIVYTSMKHQLDSLVIGQCRTILLCFFGEWLLQALSFLDIFTKLRLKKKPT